MRKKDRADWLHAMLQIAEPVIVNLAENRLKEYMPAVFHPDRKTYMHLEALGRTVMGLANAVNPDAKDFMNFSEGYGQALVDAAFLAQAVVRAPKQLYELLEEKDKRNFIVALKATRRFTPFVCNWILFSSMIEVALYV